MAGDPPTLITIPVSHFCEKSRWALQRYGLPFTEEAHVPGAHRSAAKAAGGRGSVPCLRLPRPAPTSDAPTSDGTQAQAAVPGCVDESTPILRWADEQCAAAAAAAAAVGQPLPPPLFPPGPAGAEAERLCQQFDTRLGPAVRVWAYSHLLYTPAIPRAMAAPPVPATERWALRLGGWLLLRPMMAKGMRINPANGAAALEKIKSCFDDVAALLADGRPYLTGCTFTAADLSFASLAAPAVGQAYASVPGLNEETPAAMREQLEDLRAHPAGQFALRIWAEERGVVLCSAGGGTAGGGRRGCAL